MNELEAIAKVVDSKVVEKVYDDAGSPGFKELGKVGSDLVKTARLLLAPLQLAATFQDRLERFLRELNERVPESRRVEIASEIAGPALESMKHLDERSTLWLLFKEVLFKAADREFVDLVHPAFVQIIRQLTRDEAYILSALKSASFDSVDTLDWNEATRRFENLKVESSTIPEKDLHRSGAVSIYYAHLDSLSLVQWPVLKQEPIMIQEKQVGVRRYSTMQLTEFGRLFVSACLPEGGLDSAALLSGAAK